MAKGERVTPAYIRLIITMLAGLLTIGLTAVAFWLSYEHLHDVAGEHGLSGERAWAWPATLDMFIVIGELLILRASLMQKIDPWSWVCASIGSVGSITLNVVGVANGDPLDYTVAAVPPVAALFAFGILMRQLHQAITAYVNAPPVIIPGDRTVPPGNPVFEEADPIDHIAAAFGVPRNLVTDGMSQEEMDAASRRLLHAVEHPEEDDEDDAVSYGPDAFRYVPGDEDRVDAPGQDASIEALRRSADYLDNAMQTSRLIMVPSPPTINPASSAAPWQGQSADLFIHDEAFGVLGTSGEIYTASVGTPEPGLSRGEEWRRNHPEYVLPGDVPQGHEDTRTERFEIGDDWRRLVRVPQEHGDTGTEDGGHPPEDTQEDVPVPVSRPVPRPRTTGTKASAPGRVRDILGTSPRTTDEELRDILKGEEFVPNTINKAIKRVRKEMGT
jgi:hypothetical protein